MGAAKRAGTFEERLAKALEKKKQAEVEKKLTFSPTTKTNKRHLTGPGIVSAIADLLYNK